MSRALIAVASIASMIALGAAYLKAGPLNPPAGPVASTYKTLGDIEPRTAINPINTPGDVDSVYKITLPGTYYLTQNVSGAAGKAGIEILTSGVTIDLMGFRLQGSVGSLDGIVTNSGIPTQIVIRNGTVSAWGGSGISLNVNGSDTTIENVHAIGNVGDGIHAGNQVVVRDCIARGNGGTGIECTSTATVSGCISRNNFMGFSIGAASTMDQCTARENTSLGFGFSDSTIFTSCTALSNGSDGFGTALGSACTFSFCSANENKGNGIRTGAGCTIQGCSVMENDLNGIHVGSTCTVRDNTCITNGFQAANDGAGIYAKFSDNRIEGNLCTGADRGIHVDAPGNTIIRNTCSGNSIDWVIVANNVVGPILDRRNPASAAISGFSAPDSTGSTHPNANFSF